MRFLPSISDAKALHWSTPHFETKGNGIKRISMKHYDTAQWLRFMRAEVDDDLRAVMQRHLDARCLRCSASLELLRKVDNTATRDSAVKVPDSAVRFAKAVFGLDRPEQVRFGSKILAHLTFDSFREPAAAGVRSRRHLARQALFEAGDYTIDLRIEPDLERGRVLMVGQIANRVEPNLPLVSVPIKLRSGRHEIGRCSTNEFGEFQMIYDPKMPLRLLIPVPVRSQHVEIDLPGASPKSKNRRPLRPASPPRSEKS